MNKYKILMIVMFFILVFSFSKVNAIVKEQSLLGKTICLDAGHEGEIKSSINRTSCSKALIINKAKYFFNESIFIMLKLMIY